MLILVQSVGVIIIRILRTNVCKTNFTPLVFHFQLPQLGTTQLWGFPHFPTFAFYSHNAVFSHTSFKWFSCRRKFLYNHFAFNLDFTTPPFAQIWWCICICIYLPRFWSNLPAMSGLSGAPERGRRLREGSNKEASSHQMFSFLMICSEVQFWYLMSTNNDHF